MSLASRLTKLSAVFILGCVVGLGVVNTHHRRVPPSGPNTVDVLQWCDSIEDFQVRQWKAEVARRFPDAVLIVCHGEDNAKGQWCFYPDRLVLTPVGPALINLPPMPVEEVVPKVQADHPGRTIVLVTCNPHHHRLTVPGVVYATDDVWLTPDRDANIRNLIEPDGVGNIFEFRGSGFGESQ